MIDLGDTVSLAWEVLDAAGELADAGTVTVTIGLPDGTAETETPTRVSIGRYELDYIPAQSGVHTVRCVATAPAAAFADIIDVRPVAGLGVLSLADAKEHLNKISPVSDEELRLMLPAAVERVERHTGRALSGATQVTASEVLAVKLVLAEYWRTQRAKVGRGVSGGGASGVAIESDSGLGGMAAIKTRLTDLLGPPAAEAGAAPVGSFPAAQPWPDPAGCWSRSVW